MDKPRAKTVKETREEFLRAIRGIAKYWGETDTRPMSAQERCDGVAFSILVLLDGGTLGFPAVDMYPAPHEDDQKYHEKHGENWFNPDVAFNNCQLHEFFHNKEHDAQS